MNVVNEGYVIQEEYKGVWKDWSLVIIQDRDYAVEKLKKLLVRDPKIHRRIMFRRTAEEQLHISETVQDAA